MMPPRVFLLAWLAGAGAGQLLGWQAGARAAWAGLVLTVAGAWLARVTLAQFAHAATSAHPHAAASRLLRHGVFARSRNPLYVAMLLLYAGLAGVLRQPGAWLALPMLVLWLQCRVIVGEEAKLLAAFGDEYAAYCRDTPRWWGRC
jgi:protein-S-isoprenylcysteine O-methyltransferase Ste14